MAVDVLRRNESAERCPRIVGLDRNGHNFWYKITDGALNIVEFDPSNAVSTKVWKKS